jgi:hypothetical protein
MRHHVSHIDDRLLISGDEVDPAASDRFWVAGVPFPFPGNALLVGIDPKTSDAVDQPAMEGIDEFLRPVMRLVGTVSLPILRRRSLTGASNPIRSAGTPRRDMNSAIWCFTVNITGTSCHTAYARPMVTYCSCPIYLWATGLSMSRRLRTCRPSRVARAIVTAAAQLSRLSFCRPPAMRCI